MFKIFGFFVLICATCRALPPQPAAPEVSCEEIPLRLLSCANLPRYPYTKPKNCFSESRSSTTCDEMTCIMLERGFITGASVNHTKMSEVLDEYSSSSPIWTAAFEKAKTTCFVEKPVNVYNINCPAYDVTFCIFASVIKNTPPTSWSSEPYCKPMRQYADTCPECPECFALAFHALPR